MATEWTKMPKGQKSAFHDDFPIPPTGVKENRKTGEQPRGTAALRSAQNGKKEGSDSIRN